MWLFRSNGVYILLCDRIGNFVAVSIWCFWGSREREKRYYLSSSPPSCLTMRRKENIAPKISFASSSLDRALGFTPGTWSLLRALAPDCRWAVLMDWDSGLCAQRLLYMHSASWMLDFIFWW